MFKNQYFRQIIPDIVFASGLVLLVLGIIFLTQFNFDNVLSGAELESQHTRENQLGSTVPDKDTLLVAEKQSALLNDNGSKSSSDIVNGSDIESSFSGSSLAEKEVNLKKKLKVTANKMAGSDQAEKVTIIIPEGSSGREVAKILEQNNLMAAHEFIKYLSIFHFETRIRAGRYSFDSNSKTSDILSKILLK